MLSLLFLFPFAVLNVVGFFFLAFCYRSLFWFFRLLLFMKWEEMKCIPLTLQCCMFLAVSSHSWASRLLDGWMGGGSWGWCGGSWVTFLPSGLCVCQPGHSQFSPGKLGGKNFLYVSILDMATNIQWPVCTQGTCVCFYDVSNWAPTVLWLACCFLMSTL